MNIDNIAVVLRLRKHWQAIDLGFMLAREWFVHLWLLWLLGALPLFLIASLLLHQHQQYLGIIIWWFKPVYELPLLFFLSQSMFGENPSIREIAKRYFSIVKVQLLQALTVRRFSLSRSFNNPVHLLEKLHGKQRAARIGVLEVGVANTSHWLLIICSQFELIIYLSLIIFVGYLIPEDFYDFDLSAFTDNSGLPGWLMILGYFIGISIVAPFYTAAGFCLYLSRRTQLEGWDIALNFKNLNSRIDWLNSMKSVVLICLVSCIAIIAPQNAQASEAEKAKATITKVLAEDDFGKTETRKTLAPKKPPEEESDDWQMPDFLKSIFAVIEDVFIAVAKFLSSIAGVLEALLWIGLILIVILLLWRFRRWFKWQTLTASNSSAAVPKPARLFGLDVSEASLPENISAEVQRLLAQNDFRAALSLLYRASLAYLINVHHMEISESFTEGECLSLVESSREDPEISYFRALTQCWQHLAYAHQLPTEAIVRTLSTDWEVHYGELSE